MMSTFKSPMMELEIPGSIIFTIPVTAINEDVVDNDISAVANTWKEIMDTALSMVGYKLPRPMRYVTDIEITHGNMSYPNLPSLLKIYW